MTDVKTSRLILPLVIVGLASIALALPVSNYFIVREKLPNKSGDPEFAKLASVLQNSCADCHGYNMTSYPLYFQLPIAKDVIARDIAEAQGAFQFTRANLTGEDPFSASDLAKVAMEISEGTMPPPRYKALHWNAGVDGEVRRQVLAYIKRKSEAAALSAVPVENPFNPDAKKVALGEKLFFDKRLSGDNTISCAACHSPDKGGADGLPTARGIGGQIGPINVPTVYNSAFNFCQFWDGRAKDLKEQAGGPVNNPVEMGSNWKQVLSKIEHDPEYEKLTEEAYGKPLNADNVADTVTGAIAEYEKTLLTPNSRFDKYLKGDLKALSEVEKQGYDLFNDKGCASCHSGVALGGMSFEKMGVKGDYFAYRVKALGMKETAADNGRFNVTKIESDRHKFKVPTLRNIALTAPYFHDGSVKELSKAVDIMAQYQRGVTLSQDENKALVAFLQSLNGERQSKP